jgi:hypothetical protein
MKCISKWCRLGLFVAVAAVIGACAREAEQKPATSAQREVVEAQAEREPATEASKELSSLHKGKPVSEAEAKNVAKAIQEATEAKDAPAFAQVFDWDAFRSMVLSAFEGLNQETSQLRKGFTKEMTTIGPVLAGQIFQHFEGGGSYTFLRVLDRPDGKRLLFRLRNGSGALNYHEICLVRRPEGVRARGYLRVSIRRANVADAAERDAVGPAGGKADLVGQLFRQRKAVVEEPRSAQGNECCLQGR